MKSLRVWMLALAVLTAWSPVIAEGPAANKQDDKKPEAPPPQPAKDETSRGSVIIAGQRVDYRAVAGMIALDNKDDDGADPTQEQEDAPPSAQMFYVAYFKTGKDEGAARPVTFIYNGGPGSASVWLHMGALGPKRVLTRDDEHTPPAPYQLADNDASILDASDLVFIDAPGTGFGRIYGKDKEKAYYGVDEDAKAFVQFITRFLSQYDRWNSPKYLFGESYGTTRSAIVANILQSQKSVDLNGIILLSQILSFDSSPDMPQFNPGIDLPYALALPTYAATAWYHQKLPQQPRPALQDLLREVEQFALTDYLQALAAGATLSEPRRRAIAERLHQYTGLPVAYWLKADLRVNGGMFGKTLQDDTGETTGRFDTRFRGPTMDLLSKEAEYDPQSAAISSAYVSAFNDYVRKTLHFGRDQTYKADIDIEHVWNFLHQAPGAPFALPQSANVLPDLADAMKYNPQLKVLLNTGYFDLATPYFAAVYELQHLPIPASLRGNLQVAFYESGHMVYAHPDSLRQLHDRVTRFIRETDGSSAR